MRPTSHWRIWSTRLALVAAGASAGSAQEGRPGGLAPAALVELAGRARALAGELGLGHTSEPVREGQREVEERLSELIAALEQQEASDGDEGSDSQEDEQRALAQDGGKSGPEGVRRSAPAGGPGGEGELGGARGAPADLAGLPPGLRDKVLQARTQGFPPAYEALLADYYRRLARQETGASPRPEAPPERDDGRAP